MLKLLNVVQFFQFFIFVQELSRFKVLNIGGTSAFFFSFLTKFSSILTKFLSILLKFVKIANCIVIDFISKDRRG